MEFFNKITELKVIREQKSNLSVRESELSKPIIKDVSLIPNIYNWFLEILSERDCAPRDGSVYQRKKFLLIILYLYSPSALAGGKASPGIRKRVGDALGVHSQSTISDNCSDVIFLYQNYSNFRDDVERIYSEILKRLNIEE